MGVVVKQGDQIARVGSVGNSLTGHIHFMVKQSGTTIGVSFTDVNDDNGIPRTFSSYTSGNRRVP
jgi:murein DD-endopeptidase MepM/ murein hydrolase activator NlpD